MEVLFRARKIIDSFKNKVLKKENDNVSQWVKSRQDEIKDIRWREIKKKKYYQMKVKEK